MKIIFSLLFLFFIKRSIADDTFFEDKSNTKWDEVYERCLKVGHADISHSSRSRQKQELIDLNDIINIRSRNISWPHFESGTTFKLKPLLLWPNGRVPTDFEGKFLKDERDKLRCAIAFFHAFTCVRFVKRKPRDHNYLLIKKSSRGCMSEEIGRIQGGGNQTLNLEQHNYHCWDHGTIVHELMHVIGRFHEHSRMDRNDYIHIHFNNIPIDEYFQYKMTEQLGYEHEDVGYYDYESIMHYPSDMGDKQVISALFKGDYDQQATNNDAMGQRNRPTKQDEIKINLLYKCNERSTTRSTTTTIARDGIGLSLSTVMTIEATNTITTETTSIDTKICETGFVKVKTDYTFTEYYQTPDIDEFHPLTSRRSDWKQGHGRGNYWIKLEGSGGTRILDRQPISYRLCSTSFPGYIIGEHPHELYQVVHREMCYYGTKYQCNKKIGMKNIGILKCGHNQFLYKFNASQTGYSAFCSVPSQPPTNKPICEGTYKTIQTNYTFTEYYRNRHSQHSKRCDWRDNVQDEWIKLEGDGGSSILDHRPNSSKLCGTDYPGYIIGNHPMELYESVHRTLCYYNGFGCNNTLDQKNIEIVNCGHNQFLYRIDKFQHCNMAFCTVPRNLPDVCVVEDPCRNNGTCLGNGLTYICNCTTGWSGINCTQPDSCLTIYLDRSIKVLLIGRYGSRSSMEYYYPYQSQYNSLINVTMIKPRQGHTSIVMNDGKIMTMGGFDGDELNNVEIFDPITNTSTKGPNMKKTRAYCDSAILNGIVYVCGGRKDGYNRLSSCESYQSGVWEYIAQMHKVRYALRLISLNGYLYAIGGYDGNNELNSVEKYNPKSNSWMMVKSMQIPRVGPGAAVLNGFMYVCGGYNIHSCERYDPALNKWSNITETIIYRDVGLRMVSDGHHLFAFGGEYNEAEYSVEMYDPKKDKWILLKKSLIHERWHFSAVVLH